MTFDADILERPAPAARPSPDPRIAVAEVWVCMLTALMKVGIRLACFLAEAIAPAESGPKGSILACRFFGDPVLAFSRVARAARLAASLALRIEDEIAAFRAGRPLGPVAPAIKGRRLDKEALDLDLETLAEAVEKAEGAERLDGDLHERVRREREDPEFYRLLNGPLKDAVAAICADLGLKPDWSLWTEDGFPQPPGGEEDDWIAFFVPKGEVVTLPSRRARQPAKPPPRRDGPRAWDKDWRPPWPPPEPPNLSPAPYPDDPVGGSRRAALLGTTIIAGAPGGPRRAITRLLQAGRDAESAIANPPL